MKLAFLTVILFLTSLLDICSVHAQSGPPPTQEVEATGHGANADEAFKQAVVDAVRQVVGTLVSAENVISNERVIKDEVLTLSNGFVEKVLTQTKYKQDDGTWQVKLKCIIRKGQLYGNLQKANIPTIRFDGVSLFADVVSQIDHQESSVKMIANAFRSVTSDLVSATMVEEKPKIVERNDKYTDVTITWRASVDIDSFFKNCAPALDAALSSAATSKSRKPMSVSVKDTKNSGVMLATCYVDEVGVTGPDGYVTFHDLKNTLAAVPVIKKNRSWDVAFYRIDQRILGQIPYHQPRMIIISHFKDAAGDKLLDTVLTCLEFRALELNTLTSSRVAHSVVPLLGPCGVNEGNHGKLARLMQELESERHMLVAVSTKQTGFGESQWGWTTSQRFGSVEPKEYFGYSILNLQSVVRIPTALLSRISKVDLSVELDKSDSRR